MSIQTELSSKLKELRKAHGFNQEFVASCLSIARQTYSHYENGRRTPSYDVMVKLAELYQISLDSLISEPADNRALPKSQHSQANPSAESLSDFLAFCNDPANELKLKYLNQKEKELLYYFKQIATPDKWEFLEFAKILARKKR